MDIRTLVIATALLSGEMAILFCLLRVLHRDIPGLGCWAAGGVCLGVGFLAAALRGIIAPRVPLLVSNAGVIGGGMLMYFGSARFIGQSVRTLPPVLVAAVSLALIALVGPGDAMGDARVVIFSTGFGGLMTANAWILSRRGPVVRRMSAVLYALLALSQFGRSLWVLVFPQGTDLFKSGGFGVVSYLIGVASIFLLGAAHTLMIAERLRGDLARQASHDHLTGILNRRGFDLTAESLVPGCARDRAPLSLLMLDLDHFKRINDSRGHAAGDRALVRFAGAIRSLLRGADVFARMGGEEFVVLLPRCGRSEAARIAERIRLAVAAFDGRDDGLTVSIGGHCAPDGGADVTTMIRRADLALYRAKAEGRNRTVFSDDPPSRGIPPGNPAIPAHM